MVPPNDVALSNAQSLRTLEDLEADLATLTGLNSDYIAQQVAQLNFTTFQFQGLNLVSPAIADELIDRWAQSIKEQLRQRSASVPPKVTAMFPAAGTPRLPRRPKAESKSTSAPSRSSRSTPAAAPPVAPVAAVKTGSLPDIELKVPRDVFKLVSTRYDVAIRKVLPKDTETQQAYLQHIVAESEQGHEFLTQIAIVLAKKYKGRVGKETAYKRMLEKARTLVSV
jgi:hypothetical protein